MNYRCPLCHQELKLESASYVCANKHCFDLAKSGYINLLASSHTKSSGDNKLMVDARVEHLETGYYQVLLDAVLGTITNLDGQILADCGCGEGYYTRQIQAASKFEVYGFDLSKEAILYASKHDKLSKYAISSIFDLPLADHSVDLITSIFAPIAIQEFSRILKKDGILLIVTPGPRHLIQMKETLYEKVYLNEPFELTNEKYKLVQVSQCKDIIELQDQKQIQNCFMMTPYYYKTSLEDKAKLSVLTHLKTEIEFSIQCYQKTID